MNASLSESATLSRPAWASTSSVGSAVSVTAVGGEGVPGVGVGTWLREPLRRVETVDEAVKDGVFNAEARDGEDEEVVVLVRGSDPKSGE